MPGPKIPWTRPARPYNPMPPPEALPDLCDGGCCEDCGGTGGAVIGKCSDCRGSGHPHPRNEECPPAPSSNMCRTCVGTGVLYVDAFGGRPAMKKPCWTCNGTGRGLALVFPETR